MTRKRILSIVIPILVVLVVVGLFFLKNVKDGAESLSLDATADFSLEETLSHGLPVIVDFGADSCIPCKEMAPVLKELNQELQGKAVVRFVDVWKNASAAKGLPLEVIPTQFFFEADGTPYTPADPDAAARNGFILYTRKDTGEHVYTVHQGGLDKVAILAVLKEMGME